MLNFNTKHKPPYGVGEQISPSVRRLTANNPSKFTFRGTGTYIVGTKSVAVIDPGPKDDNHINSLLKELEDVDVSHILITHTHRDHSPAAAEIQSKKGGLLCGFGPHPKTQSTDSVNLPKNTDSNKSEDESETTEESGDTDFMPEKFLEHGEILVGDGWSIECLYTPGHISNHLCFALLEEKSIFTGDHIMGWSTSIIPPPDGRLDDYLDSLRLLIPRQEQTYFPTHGAPITNPQEYTKALLEHRENRSRQILDCLRQEPKTIPEIVAIIYKDHKKELHKPATQSVLAHLIYLHERGEVVCENEPTQDAVYSSK